MTLKIFSNGSGDATTHQRFEAKYLVSELQAEALKSYMEPYLRADANARRGESYMVNSLYLDNPALQLYWSSASGEKNRIKLRIRAYTDNPGDPVFFEIKRRINQVIRKQRAVMTRESVDRLLRGLDASDDAFLRDSADERHNFAEFRDYMEQLGARPQVMVRYMREAYVSDLEEPVRVTFDGELAALHCPRYSDDTWNMNGDWRDIDAAPVILEIKFTNVFPFWVRRAIQRFDLLRDSFAKYVSCMDGLKRDGSLYVSSRHRNEDPMWSRTI